jgi:hypothetical protein
MHAAAERGAHDEKLRHGDHSAEIQMNDSAAILPFSSTDAVAREGRSQFREEWLLKQIEAN